MHPGVRRVPAERARHAKRLGYVQLESKPVPPALVAGIVSIPVTDTTTTQQSTTSASSQTGTPIKQSSSSAPASSSTQSSSSTLSPATTSSTSSVTPSTSTQSSTATAQTSSFIPSTTSASISPTSSASASPTIAAAKSSGLSGGAIAGIIAGSVIVGVALIVFFVRKTYLRRRERKRISWNGAPGFESNPFPDISERRTSLISTANTPQRGAPPPSFEAYGQSMYSTPVPPVMRMQSPAVPTYTFPTPPLATYNNPISVSAYPTQPISPTHTPGNTNALATARIASKPIQHTPVEAIVKCTFVPTLPDELSIITSERIVIIEQYDDGWNLCANGRGEQGMVPRECLESVPSDQPDVGWRNVQRTSSLNLDARRF